MTLYLIGTGIGEKGISLEGIETAKKCDEVYLEDYTLEKEEDLSKLLGKKVTVLKREDVEQKPEETFLKKGKDIALLVGGDPMAATTHIDIINRAKELRIKTKVIHASSIISSVGETGLSIYKFGKTASIPKPQPNFNPESFYDIYLQNEKIEAHTLFLLDIGMKIKEGFEILLSISKKRDKKITENTKALAVARLGESNQAIKYNSIKNLMKENYGKGAQCVIIPSKLNFIEEEFLNKL